MEILELREKLILEDALGSSANLWDIMTALRGPDFDAEQLKRILTCRLRSLTGLTFGKIRSIFRGDAIIEPMYFSEACKELAKGYSKNKSGVRHFLAHQGQAFEVLAPILSGEEKIEANFLKNLALDWNSIMGKWDKELKPEDFEKGFSVSRFMEKYVKEEKMTLAEIIVENTSGNNIKIPSITDVF